MNIPTKTSKDRTSFFRKEYTLLRLLFVSALVTSVLTSTNCLSADPKNGYQLGVFPHYSESHIEKAYTAIAKDLSAQTSKPVNFDADDNIENFSANLQREKYDIVLVQPFDYVKIADQFSYTPVAAQKKALQALIVVRKSSPLRTLQNLLGRDLYLPPKNTAISYLAKHHLKNAEFNLKKDVNITHESTHISCLLKVIVRIADACATAPEALKLFEEKLHVTFRILDKTKPIPHVLFAIHPRVPKKDRASLKKQILSWEKTASGQQLLTLSRMEGLQKINDKNYDIVRRMKTEVDQYEF